MKTLNSQTILKLMLIAGALSWLTACGATKTSSAGFDSASQSLDAGSTLGDSALAACSKAYAGLSDFQVEVMQYNDGSGGLRSDLARVKITMAPQAYMDEAWKVVMYRWTAAPDNSTSLDSTPLSFQFERKSAANFSLIASQAYQAFYGDQIVGMADYANQAAGYTPINNATAAGFFSGATFLVNLKDATNSYQVLRVALKSGTTVMRELDVLIPTFQADPARYNADTSHHPGVLQALHPSRDKLGQSWSQAQYLSFAQTNCF